MTEPATMAAAPTAAMPGREAPGPYQTIAEASSTSAPQPRYRSAAIRQVVRTDRADGLLRPSRAEPASNDRHPESSGESPGIASDSDTGPVGRPGPNVTIATGPHPRKDPGNQDKRSGSAHGHGGETGHAPRHGRRGPVPGQVGVEKGRGGGLDP